MLCAENYYILQWYTFPNSASRTTKHTCNIFTYLSFEYEMEMYIALTTSRCKVNSARESPLSSIHLIRELSVAVVCVPRSRGIRACDCNVLNSNGWSRCVYKGYRQSLCLRLYPPSPQPLIDRQL